MGKGKGKGKPGQGKGKNKQETQEKKATPRQEKEGGITLTTGLTQTGGPVTGAQIPEIGSGFCTGILITGGVGTPRFCKPGNRCLELSLQRVSKIRKYHRLRLPHQFFEACDEHWKKETTGSVDIVETGPTVEEECPVQKNAYESRQAYHDEASGSPLEPKTGGRCCQGRVDVHA